MNGPRSFANHARYMATIQMTAWRMATEAGDKPDWILQGAFVPAVRLHLLQTYGWLLLAVSKIEPVPTRPPASVAELPVVAEGLAAPAELDTCRALEQQGWLAELMAPLPLVVRPPRRDLLAKSGETYPDVAVCDGWCAGMDALAREIDYALDES